MTAARVSQVSREVLRDATPGVRVGEAVREVFRDSAAPGVRVAQVCREVMRSRGFVPQETRFAAAVREVLMSRPTARRPHLLFATIS